MRARAYPKRSTPSSMTPFHIFFSPFPGGVRRRRLSKRRTSKTAAGEGGDQKCLRGTTMKSPNALQGQNYHRRFWSLSLGSVCSPNVCNIQFVGYPLHFKCHLAVKRHRSPFPCLGVQALVPTTEMGSCVRKYFTERHVGAPGNYLRDHNR